MSMTDHPIPAARRKVEEAAAEPCGFAKDDNSAWRALLLRPIARRVVVCPLSRLRRCPYGVRAGVPHAVVQRLRTRKGLRHPRRDRGGHMTNEPPTSREPTAQTGSTEETTDWRAAWERRPVASVTAMTASTPATTRWPVAPMTAKPSTRWNREGRGSE